MRSRVQDTERVGRGTQRSRSEGESKGVAKAVSERQGVRGDTWQWREVSGRNV